ncbi:MAG: hypothetical protein KAI43_10285 [Candidatus Aureabacteria bacterium]|nr:hypothetical protein [Candidatus Auribacterota bacterium]
MINHYEQNGLETILSPFNSYSSLNTGINNDQQKFTIDSIYQEIKDREYIKQNNLSSINGSLQDKCSDLLNFRELTRPYIDTFTKEKPFLEKEILKLEQEKRKEYVTFWKDIIFLKIRLFYELNKSNKTQKRMELLNDASK